MHNSGLLPRLNTSPFIEWDPRHMNSLADHAGNAALDIDADWCHRDPYNINIAKASRANLRLCVDGAYRRNGTAAGGMALLAYTPEEGKELILVRAGKLLPTVKSAFVAEAMALEWGLELLMDI
eukprot:11176999-Karenia_brevis.AAC.1